MVKWAFESFKALLFIALGSFVNQRMELLLFPAVTEGTFFKAFATLFITSNEGSTLPVLAKLRLVTEEVGLSAEILKIVSVHTLSFIMFMVVRAPFCLEKENVEVKICMLRQQIMD
jgi:hypothetical protein